LDFHTIDVHITLSIPTQIMIFTEPLSDTADKVAKNIADLWVHSARGQGMYRVSEQPQFTRICLPIDTSSILGKESTNGYIIIADAMSGVLDGAMLPKKIAEWESSLTPRITKMIKVTLRGKCTVSQRVQESSR
jgi:hypothetical protein